jgi:hypothetical protein
MRSMRSRCLAIGLCLAGTAVALSAPPKPSAPARPWPWPEGVYLGSAADVEQLRITHPRDYARVQRILASADQLCKAGEPKLLKLQSGAEDMHCGSLVFTSYPPQRLITFRLDNTHYTAMVFLEVEAKLAPLKLDGIRRSTAAVAVQQSLPPH